MMRNILIVISATLGMHTCAAVADTGGIITQAGDGKKWTMTASGASGASGIVVSGDATANFPDIAIELSDTLTHITFKGLLGAGHNFEIHKGSGTGPVQEGISNCDGGAFELPWTPSGDGEYTYNCAPHYTEMFGTITVTINPGGSKVCEGYCSNPCSQFGGASDTVIECVGCSANGTAVCKPGAKGYAVFDRSIIYGGTWEDLTTDVRTNWEVLGWTKDAWNVGPPPATEDMDWDTLSAEQQTAATSLGYTKASWDAEPADESESASATSSVERAACFNECGEQERACLQVASDTNCLAELTAAGLEKTGEWLAPQSDEATVFDCNVACGFGVAVVVGGGEGIVTDPSGGIMPFFTSGSDEGDDDRSWSAGSWEHANDNFKNITRDAVGAKNEAFQLAVAEQVLSYGMCMHKTAETCGEEFKACGKSIVTKAGCELVCEGHKYTETSCGAIQGCVFDPNFKGGRCMSAVGSNDCDYVVPATVTESALESESASATSSVERAACFNECGEQERACRKAAADDSGEDADAKCLATLTAAGLEKTGEWLAPQSDEATVFDCDVACGFSLRAAAEFDEAAFAAVAAAMKAEQQQYEADEAAIFDDLCLCLSPKCQNIHNACVLEDHLATTKFDALREVDCKGAGAIECSKCACLQTPASPCSTEDSTWCMANLATGNTCMQYIACPQGDGGGGGGGGGGDGDMVAIMKEQMKADAAQASKMNDLYRDMRSCTVDTTPPPAVSTTEDTPASLSMTANFVGVDLTNLTPEEATALEEAGKKAAIAAIKTAGGALNEEDIERVEMYDENDKLIQAKARRAAGDITFKIIFKTTAVVDVKAFETAITEAVAAGAVTFEVTIGGKTVEAKVTGATATEEVVLVKTNGIITPTAGACPATFATGLAAMLVGVAALV